MKEIEYWRLSVVACVIGRNPNIGLMDGYARRMWGFNNVDKVIPVKYGVFLIRFLNKEARDRALEMTNLLLDSFPIFIRQWEEGINLEAWTFDKVPIWVRTYELPLKY